MTRSRGFSVVELVAAMAILLLVLANMFSVLDPGHGTFLAQSETVDLQQRLRVVADALYKDLVMAGAGAYQGTQSGSLGYYFAPILPYRHGANDDDPSGTFTNESTTVMFVPTTAAQTTLATPGPAGGSGDVDVGSGPGCPVGDAACGFKAGMPVLLYDGSGLYDTFVVANVQQRTLTLHGTGAHATYTNYQPQSTKITQFTNAVYYLRRDPATGVDQLMFAGGGAGSDVPVADHVVALAFEYYGDPQPPVLTGVALDDPRGPWTTYGPPPPELDRQIPTGGYPVGENCTFTVDPITHLHAPRLAVLGGHALVHLTAAQLSGLDGGPWCPDATNANRWDADLLRIRAVEVTIRVQAANAALRGPASVLFTHGGTSKSGNRWLPDQEMRFEVTPRNLRFGSQP